MASEIERINKTLRRRRIKRTVTALFAVAVLAVILYVLSGIFLRVGVIAVENASRYDSSELLAKFDELRGEPILRFDKNRAKDRLQTSLPYVKNVTFSVSFPDRLNVSVEGASGRYSVAADGVYLCLDDDFKVLEISSSSFPDLLQIDGLSFGVSGDEETEEKSYLLGKKINTEENINFSILSELFYELEKNGLYDRVTYIDFTKKYNLTFYLDGIIQVELGTSEELDRKMDMLLEILARNPADRRAVINVRNPSEGRYRSLE